jgi:hypothetical protein
VSSSPASLAACSVESPRDEDASGAAATSTPAAGATETTAGDPVEIAANGRRQPAGTGQAPTTAPTQASSADRRLPSVADIVER